MSKFCVLLMDNKPVGIPLENIGYISPTLENKKSILFFKSGTYIHYANQDIIINKIIVDHPFNDLLFIINNPVLEIEQKIFRKKQEILNSDIRQIWRKSDSLKRIITILCKNNLYLVKDLVSISPDSLISIKGISRSSYAQLNNNLSSFGLSLGMSEFEIDEWINESFINVSYMNIRNKIEQYMWGIIWMI